MASGYTRHDYKCVRDYGGKSGKGDKIKGGHVKWSEQAAQPKKATKGYK